MTKIGTIEKLTDDHLTSVFQDDISKLLSPRTVRRHVNSIDFFLNRYLSTLFDCVDDKIDPAIAEFANSSNHVCPGLLGILVGGRVT